MVAAKATLMALWGGEFRREHRNVDIDVVCGTIHVKKFKRRKHKTKRMLRRK